MKALMDFMQNDVNAVLTQFNDYDESTAMAAISMCIEEYCLAHNLNATEMFKELLETHLRVVNEIGVYK